MLLTLCAKHDQFFPLHCYRHAMILFCPSTLFLLSFPDPHMFPNPPLVSKKATHISPKVGNKWTRKIGRTALLLDKSLCFHWTDTESGYSVSQSSSRVQTHESFAICLWSTHSSCPPVVLNLQMDRLNGGPMANGKCCVHVELCIKKLNGYLQQGKFGL